MRSSTHVFVPTRARRRPPGVAAVVCGCVLVLVACRSDAARTGSAGAEIRDSAGVTIVENAPLPAEAGGLRLGDAPALEIGVAEGDPAEQLYRVRGALRLGDGRVVVANAGTSEIRMYDPSGRPLSTWGGEGEGPGEFLGIQALVRWPGDSLAVWDRRTRRITVFSTDGELGRSLPLPVVEGMDFPDFAGVLPSGELVVGAIELPSEPTTGLLRMPVHVAVVRPDGEMVADLGRHPGDETYMRVGEGTIEILRPDYAKSYVLEPVGEQVLASSNEHFELRLWGLDGSLERVVRLAEPRRVVTDADRAADLERRLAEVPEAARPGIRAARERLPLPDTLPAMAGVVPDARGHVWIEPLHLPAVDDSVRWIILDPAGRAIESVMLPARLEVFEIGADWLIGSLTDELGVERVQVWPLSRGG